MLQLLLRMFLNFNKHSTKSLIHKIPCAEGIYFGPVMTRTKIFRNFCFPVPETEIGTENEPSLFWSLPESDPLPTIKQSKSMQLVTHSDMALNSKILLV